MTTLTAPDQDSVSTTGPPAAPKLRLRRAGRADQSFEIRGGKCTIGSSPRCQVCLPPAEAQPLQCLLSLESGAAIVTRWASGVLLNGHTFAKQPFQSGDLLSIGPWEIELETRGVAPRPAPSVLRETIDFTPPAKTPAPFPPTALPNLRATEPFVPAEPVAPVNIVEADAVLAKRPAAKTVLISSRQTDPFADLLGPAKPIVTAEIAPSATTAEPEVALRNFSSQSFEDRLVLKLWAGNFAARKRAKALTKTIRAARQRTAELSRGVTELEQRLTGERTLHESAAADLWKQLESLRAELAQAVADRDRLAAELETLQNARPRTAPPDPRLQTLADAAAKAEREASELRDALTLCNDQIAKLRQQQAAAEAALATATAAQAAAEKSQLAAEQKLPSTHGAADQKQSEDLRAERQAREQERLIADQEAARLREQVYACESQIELFRQQLAEAAAERTARDEQIVALQNQQSQWLTQCQALERDRAATLAEMTDQRDELQRQLDEMAARPAAILPPTPSPAPVSWSTSTPAAPFEADAEEDSEEADEVDADWAASTAAAAPEWRAWEPADEAPETEEPSEPTWAALEAREEDLVDEPIVDADEPPPADLPAEAPVVEEPAGASFAPPSFIDKYRHLLEDESDDAPVAPSRRPILDEEHLSLSKATGASSQDDDSDEALEAYMSNMMRRVRGDSTSPASSQAPPPSHSAPRPAASAPATPEAAAPAPAAQEPEIELDANGMLRLVRKQHAATDMGALRELANSSARTAIAHHHQRRHVESAVTKSLVCVAASAASAYLMLTATGVDSPWFWGGCVTLVMAVASAAQLGLLAWHRLGDGRRTSLANAAASSVPQAQFGAAGVTTES